MLKQTKPKKKPFHNIERTSRGLTSYAQAEGVTGYRVADMKRWKKSGCPAFRNNTIYIDELKDWLDKNGIDPTAPAEDSEDGLAGTPEEVNKERVRTMRLQQRKLDREHEAALGELVYKADVKKEVGSVMDQIVSIIKKTVDRQQFNAIAKQFQSVDFKGLHEIQG